MSKEFEEQNKKIIEEHANVSNEDKGKIYNIPIGVKSEIEKKKWAENMRQNVIATLDRQREEK